jgi:hypothetical protein
MKTALYGRIFFGASMVLFGVHRTDVARCQYLAKLGTYLEPAFWHGHRRVSHDSCGRIPQ